MTFLADHISVRGRFARSANLERDADRPEPLEGYIVTDRALDAVERIATIAAAGRAGGAWSLTGPYGSGKSSLGLLLDAALGPSDGTRQRAWELIEEASSPVGELIRQAHQRHRTQESGFHRGLTTANREPLTHTVLRGLYAAVLRKYGKIPPASEFRAAKTLRGALEDTASDDPRRTGPSPAAMVEIARGLAEDAPLLLIIDEFGKNIEAIRDDSNADPYLLQQLAEAGQGSGLPIFILTLQHLSFEDYLAGADSARCRDWAKVQGRFEDIAYVESAHQTRALIGTVFNINDDGLQDRIARWARPHAEVMQSLGVADLADPNIVASCYPLHPMATMVLPELCNRYGQHERTLFSFLTSPDTASAASFLATSELPDHGPIPSLGLETVYDYFVTSGVLAAMSATRSRRWIEIVTRLRDTHGLSKRQTRTAKTIALLNLVSTTGTIRASSRMLALTDIRVNETLVDLEAAGIIIYRDFVDEYRVWQGTDVDIRRLLDVAHQQVLRQPLVEILSAVDQPLPVVAARHSAEHDVLRVFARRYSDGSEQVQPLDPFSPYDGEVLLVVGSDGLIPSLAKSTATAKPVAVAIPSDVAAIDRAAREVVAVTNALQDPGVETDWVARRELGERLAETRAVLDHSIITTFNTNACRWILLDASGEIELPNGRGSVALSAVADRAYSSTPIVRNEMLNRTDLTSQGAKARRVLIEAMIKHGADRGLGLDGYGPEVAMYRSFLERTGLHSYDARNGTMVFCKPTDRSLRPAWDLLEDEFKRAKTRRIDLRDVYAALVSPPVGMKAAVIPVFVTAALLAFSDEIAIYEHGTFKPLLTPVLSERMVRNPGHFQIKHFANTTGARRQVIDAFTEHLPIRTSFRKHRVPNVLAIVGNLVSQMRNLDRYTLRTRNLTSVTLKARDTLMRAVEPDELLFDNLPNAVGFRPIPADMEVYSGAHVYAKLIGTVLDELNRCQDKLLNDLFQLLLETSAETTRLAITGQAAALENEVLNPTIRAFVLTLANDGVDTDTDWINAIATVVAEKAPTEWTDDDLKRFRRELPEQLAAFQRLVALHAEHRADGGGGFNALRVTITRSDGSEHIRLVGIDQNQRHHVEKALDGILAKLTDILGSSHRAQKTLLALLGERLLPIQVARDNEARVTSIDRRAQYG